MEPFPPATAPARREAEASILTEYPPPKRERVWLHALLFALTATTTVFAGGQWGARAELWTREGFALLLDPVFLIDGVRYAVAFLGFLTVHEFGHYLTARHYRIDVSLPYYLPIPPGLPILNIGTFGAVIRIRERIPRTRQLFDVGVAGPLAGAVVALGALLYGLATLPPPTYLLSLGGHEALKAYILLHGAFPEVPPDPGPMGLGALTVGQTPLFWLLSRAFADVPPMFELYHYPVLFAGWLGLFFTALNLLPVGQLDGGHVTYALFGPRWHGRIARAVVVVLLFSATLGFVLDLGPAFELWAQEEGHAPALGLAATWLLASSFLYFLLSQTFAEEWAVRAGLFGLVTLAGVALRIGGVAERIGWSGWFFWCLLLVVLVKVDHPPEVVREPLTPGRRALGVLALVLFALCFSFRPLYFA